MGHLSQSDNGRLDETRRVLAVPSLRGRRLPSVPSESGENPPLDQSVKSQVLADVHQIMKESEEPAHKMKIELLMLLNQLEVREATVQDIPSIMVTYQQNLFQRAVFETIARRNEDGVSQEDVEKAMGVIGGPGELSPIPFAEWERRINNERVLVITDKQGKIVLVASYVIGSEAYRKLEDKSEPTIVQQEVARIQPHESQSRWFELMEKGKYKKIIMVRDGFSAPEWQNQGALPLMMAKVIEYEIQRPESEREIQPDQLDKWYALYWVNLFNNVRIKGRETKNFPENQYNRGTVGAINRAGGSFLGESQKFELITLPSEEDENKPHETSDGRQIEVGRGYFYGILNIKKILPVIEGLRRAS